jgi:hypothetical protein
MSTFVASRREMNVLRRYRSRSPIAFPHFPRPHSEAATAEDDVEVVSQFPLQLAEKKNATKKKLYKKKTEVLENGLILVDE